MSRLLNRGDLENVCFNREWMESYQTTDKNLYTNELLQAVSSSSSPSEHLADKNENVLNQLRSQLAKVSWLFQQIAEA